MDNDTLLPVVSVLFLLLVVSFIVNVAQCIELKGMREDLTTVGYAEWRLVYKNADAKKPEMQFHLRTVEEFKGVHGPERDITQKNPSE